MDSCRPKKFIKASFSILLNRTRLFIVDLLSGFALFLGNLFLETILTSYLVYFRIVARAYYAKILLIEFFVDSVIRVIFIRIRINLDK